VTERQPGSDLIGELQRWLVRSGARSVSRELSGQVRTVLGGGNTHGDVWENATADYESPECQWCPICRARRRLRESGPGLSSTVAAAGDAVSVVLQDAAAAFEAAVAAAGRQAGPRDEAPASGAVWDEATDEPARPLPRIVPGPPAGVAEPGEAAGATEAAGAAGASAEPAGPPAEPAGTDPAPGPAAPSGPGEHNPTQG
jgi:hypothetical protein